MPSFVLELEISFSRKLLTEYKQDPGLTPGTARTLDKKLDAAVSIRNTAKGEALKRLHKLQHDREYQGLQKEYAARKKRDPKADVSDLSKRYAACMHRCGYSEYGLHEYIVQAKHHYGRLLGIDECQKLATQAFQAVERVRLGDSGRVIFYRRSSDTSVEGKSHKSTLKYAGDCCIQFGKGNLYPLVLKKNDRYAAEALTHKVKYVRVLRKTVRGKRRYLAQLVMHGIPPRTRHLEYGRKNSRVGLDEGTTTIAITSKKEVALKELAPMTAIDEKKMRRLNRAIDRSRRSTNPGNYDKDGSVKKGHLDWNKSKHCIGLEAKRRELYRKSAWNRRCSHGALANHILSLGLDIRVEEMKISALAKRSSTNAINKKNGRIRSRKRYGKTVMNRAPALLIRILERKLGYLGLAINKVDTSRVKASQYDHKSDIYIKKPLSERWHTFQDGTKVQRDLYSSFLICYTNGTFDQVDREACKRNYQTFKQLHDEEIARLRKADGSTLRWYTA